MAAYRIDIRNSTGTLQAAVSDYLWLTYRKAVNEVGILQFALAADHGAVQYLADKSLVEVWRRDADLGVDWHCDYYGIVRTTQYSYPAEGPETFTVWAPSMAHLLSWRVVAWTAGYADRSQFTGVAAETIANTLVSYNACANATVANGRIREGAITGLTVEADGAGGNTLDWNCAYANLLTTLQELARAGGGDWDVITTAPATWQWRWYTGQLGTDRSATVRFALNLGNMANPMYTASRAAEKTAAIAGGQGEGSARTIVTSTGGNYTSSNDLELFIDARNEATTSGVLAKAVAALDEAEARPTFSCDLLQTYSCRYHSEFGLGDLVTALYRSTATTVKVRGVNVSFSPEGKESLQFELETV